MLKVFEVLRFLAVLTAILAVERYNCSAQNCPRVAQTLSEANRAQYAQLISAHLRNGVLPNKIRVTRLMQSGAWSAVFASSPLVERGVFFFHASKGKSSYADTWGGVPAGDSAEVIAAWTTKLDTNFPHELAICFAEAVEAGN